VTHKLKVKVGKPNVNHEINPGGTIIIEINDKVEKEDHDEKEENRLEKTHIQK
jgi:hypothetical protein